MATKSPFVTKWRMTSQDEFRWIICKTIAGAERSALMKIAKGYRDVRIENERGKVIVSPEDLKRRREEPD
jgi:hypothetical protein